MLIQFTTDSPDVLTCNMAASSMSGVRSESFHVLPWILPKRRGDSGGPTPDNPDSEINHKDAVRRPGPESEGGALGGAVQEAYQPYGPSDLKDSETRVETGKAPNRVLRVGLTAAPAEVFVSSEEEEGGGQRSKTF
jgi:hypothetical protein